MIDHEKKEKFLAGADKYLERFGVDQEKSDLFGTWLAYRWDEAFNAGLEVGVKAQNSYVCACVSEG